MAENEQVRLEESDNSTLTDLSSIDLGPESHHRYSSASLIGLPGSVAERAACSTTNHHKSLTLPTHQPHSGELLSLRRGCPVDAAMHDSPFYKSKESRHLDKQELQRLLALAYEDLDKLIKHTMLVSEENNSLKEILKEAVIICEDGNLQDYSQTLVQRDQDLPILQSLTQRHFLTSSNQTPEPSSEHPRDYNQEPACTSEQLQVSESIFDISMDADSQKIGPDLNPKLENNSQNLKSVPVALLEDSSQEPGSIISSKRETESQRVGSRPIPKLTYSLVDSQLESSGLSIYCSSPPQPTVAETFIEAVGGQTNVTENTIELPKAELSIKKLRTLSQSNKENGSKRSSFRRGRRHGSLESNKTKKIKPLPKVIVNPSINGDLGTEEVVVKKPTFFTSDMLSVIMERNELKEKVHQLKEKVKELEEEAARVQIDVSDMEHTLADEREKNGVNQNTRLRAATCSEAGQRFIKDVLVIGYKKKERAYVYVIHTTWSDGQRFEIYRRYGEFFTYHNRLQQLLQDKIKSTNNKLPTLPTIDNVLSLFGRTNKKEIVEQRLGTINEYCQVLLCELNSTISRNEVVLGFFRPKSGDTQLQNLGDPKSQSELTMSTLLVQSKVPTGGQTFEEYISLADYEAKNTGELSVRAGEIVRVISREATGWWEVSKVTEFVGGEELVGYLPGDFLQRYDPALNNSCVELGKQLDELNSPPTASTGTEAATEQVDIALQYVAIEDYSTNDPRQLCFTEGEQVIVIEKSEDGWWLVAKDDKQGWAPATFLQSISGIKGECLIISLRAFESTKGIKYVTKADFKGEFDGDISFPEEVSIEVIKKSLSGWWIVRYEGKTGMAPASMLVTKETQDLRHDVSGILSPPPRSKRFLLQSHTQHSNKDKEATEEIIKEGIALCSSSSGSEDNSTERSSSTNNKSVSKHVVTNIKHSANYEQLLTMQSGNVLNGAVESNEFDLVMDKQSARDRIDIMAETVITLPVNVNKEGTSQTSETTHSITFSPLQVQIEEDKIEVSSIHRSLEACLNENAGLAADSTLNQEEADGNQQLTKTEESAL